MGDARDAGRTDGRAGLSARFGRTPKCAGARLRSPPQRVTSIFCLTPCFLGQIWQLYKSFARARGPSIPVIHQKVRTAMRTSNINPLARTSSALRTLSWGDPCRSDLYLPYLSNSAGGYGLIRSAAPSVSVPILEGRAAKPCRRCGVGGGDRRPAGEYRVRVRV